MWTVIGKAALEYNYVPFNNFTCDDHHFQQSQYNIDNINKNLQHAGGGLKVGKRKREGVNKRGIGRRRFLNNIINEEEIEKKGKVS